MSDAQIFWWVYGMCICINILYFRATVSRAELNYNLFEYMIGTFVPVVNAVVATVCVFKVLVAGGKQ